MESIIEQIRQSRNLENKKCNDIDISETIIDGCQVKMRFNEIGDSSIITAIQSMLMSAHFDAAFAASSGGD